MAQWEREIFAISAVVGPEHVAQFHLPCIVYALLQMQPFDIRFHALTDQHNIWAKEALHFRNHVAELLAVIQISLAKPRYWRELADNSFLWFHLLLQKNFLPAIDDSDKTYITCVAVMANTRCNALHIQANISFRFSTAAGHCSQTNRWYDPEDYAVVHSRNMLAQYICYKETVMLISCIACVDVLRWPLASKKNIFS